MITFGNNIVTNQSIAPDWETLGLNQNKSAAIAESIIDLE
jgi:hypothetical protein